MHLDKNISKMAQIFDDVSIFCKILKIMTSSNKSAIMKQSNIFLEELPSYYHPVKYHGNIFYIWEVMNNYIFSQILCQNDDVIGGHTKNVHKRCKSLLN